MSIADKHIFIAQIIKRWLLCYLLFFVTGCHGNPERYNKLVTTAAEAANIKVIQQRAFIQISDAAKIIRSGDIITRTGNDFTSETLRQLNRQDKTYSHCGIASIENDTLFVYHALGGDFNPNKKIRRDPLLFFCDPSSNRGFGIFRFKLHDAAIAQAVITAKKLYNAGIMFDMKFDLATDDRMYCTEYVYKSFLKSPQNTIHFNISHLKNIAFVGVDDIVKNPACQEIKRILYK